MMEKMKEKQLHYYRSSEKEQVYIFRYVKGYTSKGISIRYAIFIVFEKEKGEIYDLRMLRGVK